MKLATVEQMRILDCRAIEEFGIAEDILMENAAMACAGRLAHRAGLHKNKFVIFCGAGNNGGDGLALARLIHAQGGIVKVYLLTSPKKYTGAAKTNYDRVCRLSLDVQLLARAEEARSDIAHCDWVVDAIFGTGLSRDVRGLAACVIEMINESARPVLSVDIPSGVHGDTGAVMGVAIQASDTVTFGLPKIGNLLYPGFALCGKLVVSPISFPPALRQSDDLLVATNGAVALPARFPDAYKGAMGDALFIAGAANYYGAPYFAAMSFLKSGGGYARLAAPASIVPFIAPAGKEIVYLPQRETAALSLSLKAKPDLLGHAERADIVVIGPGLSLQDETRKLVRELTASIARPLLVDGDGLTALAERPEVLLKRKAPTLLTPHTGEMARLAGKTVAQVNGDRIGVLKDTARKLGVVIVLKGAHSLIGYPDGRVFVNLTGNPGMATVGSGDVLTGCIAAMVGLGLAPDLAARKGVFLHGLAGDLSADVKGMDGLTATDILERLPEALKNDRAGQVLSSSLTIPVI